MSTEPDNLVLDQLRHTHGAVDGHTVVLSELRDGQVLIRSDINTLAGHSLHQEQRIATLEAKMQTLFKRLDLRDDSGG